MNLAEGRERRSVLGARVGRIICDIANPDGSPFAGCPRTTLKRAIAEAARRRFTVKAGPEAEFFLFQTRNGRPTTESHDAASYFDLSPVDQGEDELMAFLSPLFLFGALAGGFCPASNRTTMSAASPPALRAIHASCFRFIN